MQTQELVPVGSVEGCYCTSEANLHGLVPRCGACRQAWPSESVGAPLTPRLVISYLVDRLYYDRDEAEALMVEMSYEDFMPEEQIEEMKQYLGV